MLGISPDEPEAMRKFADNHDLGFTLLADPDHEVAEKYGAWGEKSMYGKKYMGMLRSTFIVDAEGQDRPGLPQSAAEKARRLVLKALANSEQGGGEDSRAELQAADRGPAERAQALTTTTR